MQNMMKITAHFIALALASVAFAQSDIPVYLDPTSDAPQIGSLEAASDAVAADWPSGADARPGWQPVYYQGAFDVYVDNNDIAKDLSPKPGSLYYLEPSKEAPKLATATERDQTDIISVDTWFCKMRLHTIVTGYVPTNALQSSVQEPQVPQTDPNSEATPSSDGELVRVVQGVLKKTGMIARNRTGMQYALTNAAGETLTLVDIEQVPDRVQIDRFLNETVDVTGSFKVDDAGDTIVILAQSIKKAN